MTLSKVIPQFSQGSDSAALQKDSPAVLYTFGEAIFNSITHGAGVLLSLAGLVTLVAITVSQGYVRSIISYGIYGLTLVILYVCSTIYHSAGSGKTRSIFRILDHASIYLLIAGSYTPITLVYLGGVWGWSLFGIVWGLAIVGVVLNMASFEKTKRFAFALYFLMGWLAVVAVRPMLLKAPPGLLAMILAGGLFYTAGIIFFTAKKIPFHHGIWHLFVLAGSACHFLGFLFYLT